MYNQFNFIYLTYWDLNKMATFLHTTCSFSRMIRFEFETKFHRNMILINSNPPLVNTMRPRRNEQHFADDIFKRIFFNENVWISINISLKFVPKGLINNNPALVQIMAWRRSGDKPLSEPMIVSLPTHICVTQPQWVKIMVWYLLDRRIYASIGLSMLIHGYIEWSVPADELIPTGTGISTALVF